MLSLLQKFFNKHFGPGSSVYGILRPCKRCVYQGSYESILIISKERGPRIIILPGRKVYVRKVSCIGYKECGRCFDQVLRKDPSLPCKWKRI